MKFIVIRQAVSDFLSTPITRLYVGNGWLKRSKLGVLLTFLAFPQFLWANHGVEAAGAAILGFILIIGVALCIIPSLVYLIRKKSSPVLAYFVMLIDFGIAFFFLAISEGFGGGVFGVSAIFLMGLGTWTLVKLIKQREAKKIVE